MSRCMERLCTKFRTKFSNRFTYDLDSFDSTVQTRRDILKIGRKGEEEHADDHVRIEGRDDSDLFVPILA